MKVAIYPGSFDPITYGHIDIAERVAKIFDKVIIAILVNSEKKPLFGVDERLDMIRHSVTHICNVEVLSYNGMLVELAKEKKANCIIRGLRAVTEYEHEIQIAHINKVLNSEIETLFLTTDIKYSYLSSSIVKEVAFYKGDISKFVTNYVRDKLVKKFLN